MPDHKRNFSFAAFIVGGILGASAAALLSPKRGKDIRAEIKFKAGNYSNKVRENTNKLISNSRSSAELLIRKAEDMMDIVQQYAKGRIDRPVSVIEKEIAGIKAAMAAAKTAYSLNPGIRESEVDGGNGHSSINDFNDEMLPKQLGMGKGRSRKN